MNRFFILVFFLFLYSCNSNDKKNESSTKQATDKSTIRKTYIERNNTDFNTMFVKKSDIKLKPDKKHLITSIDELVVTKNNFIVADKRGKQLLVFNRNGKLQNCIGRVGDGPGEFRRIEDIDVNKQNEILLLDNWKVSKYKLNGGFVKLFRTISGLHISTDLNDGFYLYNPLSTIKPVDVFLINHYNVNGNIDRSFCNPFFECGLGSGNLQKDERGNLYVTQELSHRIQIYFPDGKIIKEIGEITNIYRPFKLKNDKVLPPIEDINKCTRTIGFSVNSKFILIQYENYREPDKFSWIDIYDKKGNIRMAGIKIISGLKIKYVGADDLFYFVKSSVDDISLENPDYYITGYEFKEIVK